MRNLNPRSYETIKRCIIPLCKSRLSRPWWDQSYNITLYSSLSGVLVTRLHSTSPSLPLFTIEPRPQAQREEKHPSRPLYSFWDRSPCPHPITDTHVEYGLSIGLSSTGINTSMDKIRFWFYHYSLNKFYLRSHPIPLRGPIYIHTYYLHTLLPHWNWPSVTATLRDTCWQGWPPFGRCIYSDSRLQLNQLNLTPFHSAVRRLFIWRLYPFIIRFNLLKGVYLVFIVNSVFWPFVTSVK